MNKTIRQSIEKNSDGEIIVTCYNRDGTATRCFNSNYEANLVSRKYSDGVEERIYKVKYTNNSERNGLRYYYIFPDGKDTVRDNKMEAGKDYLIKDGKVIYMTYPSGYSLHFIYDENGKLSIEADDSGWKRNYTYNSDGELIKEETVNNGEVTIKNYFYDVEGNRYHLEEDMDVYKDILLYKYNFYGKLISVRSLMDNEENIKIKYSPSGKILVYEEYGTETGYKYDEYDNLVYEDDTQGNWREISYEYWEG